MTPGAARIRAWDLPIRVFHWALAILVVFSFTTGKIGGSWLEWHMKSGYAILTLLLFRLSWGFVGSHTARFARFVRGPRAALSHMRALLSGHSPYVPGHNPLGGWMVLLLLAVLALQAVTGLFADDEIATQGPLAVKVSNAVVARASAIHRYNAWVIMAVAALHVVAVAIYQWVLKEDLLGPMLHGWKSVPPGARPPELEQASTVFAMVLLAVAAVVVYVLVVVYPKG